MIVPGVVANNIRTEGKTSQSTISIHNISYDHITSDDCISKDNIYTVHINFPLCVPQIIVDANIMGLTIFQIHGSVQTSVFVFSGFFLF